MKKDVERRFIQNHIADIEFEYSKIAERVPEHNLFLNKKCLLRVCSGYHLKLEIGVQREITIKRLTELSGELLRKTFAARRAFARSKMRSDKQRKNKPDEGFTDTITRNQIFDLDLNEDSYWPLGQ